LFEIYPPTLKNSEKSLSKNFLSGHRNWNTLAFRGRVVSLLGLRPVGSYLSLFSRRSLAYSICLDRLPLSFTRICFTICIYPFTSFSHIFLTLITLFILR